MLTAFFAFDNFIFCSAAVPPLVRRTAELNAELGNSDKVQGTKSKDSGKQNNNNNNKVDGVVGVINVGIMDCTAPLPSGKTVLERFQLTLTSSHTSLSFYTANGNRPFLLSPSLYSDLAPAPSRILQHLRQEVATKVYTLTNDQQAEKQCWKKKQCAIILHRSTLSSEEKAIIRQVNTHHRAVHFSTLDISKFQLTPLQSRLPPLDDALWDEVNKL